MKLLLLRCPVCQDGLKPEDEDVVIVCSSCHTPILLGEQGLAGTEVRYAQPRGGANEGIQWLPFWLFEGRVNVSKRQTQGGGRSAAKAAEQMWSVPRRLFVPAWNCSVPQARQIGRKLVESQTQFVAIERPTEANMVAAVLTPADALKLLDFIILTIEAERSDWLKDFQFTIEAPPPILWAVPAQQNRDNVDVLV